ncbi:MAG: Holliday junction resolvase RuvX [Acidobacteriota bacterium]
MFFRVPNDYPLTYSLVQQKEMPNDTEFTDISVVPADGRLVAIDPGTKRIGVAVSDEMRITARPLPIIQRGSWKKLLSEIKLILAQFDAAALIIGLPLNSDGSESEMSLEARRLARNFAKSLAIPVVLQDERVTTYEARGRLWRSGADAAEISRTLDSEAAVIILSDMIDRLND